MFNYFCEMVDKRVKPEEERKVETIVVKVSKEDKDTIIEKAKKVGLGASTYLRLKGLNTIQD